MTRCTVPRMYGADWKMPRRKAFEPEGVTLGAEVKVDMSEWHTPLLYVDHGQVWAQHGQTEHYWIVGPTGQAVLKASSALTVIGQCVQEALPIESITTERTTYVTTGTATRTRKTAAAKPAAKRATRKTAATSGKTSPVPAVVTSKWEDRKTARRKLAAELRAQGIKATPEVWTEAKRKAGIK